MFKSTMNDSAVWSFLLLVSTLTHQVAPKPLNVNQVRFRRLPPKEFSAALGSSITLECEAGSSPPPAIYWLKNGKRIVQNELDENLVIDPASGLAGKSIVVDDVNRIALSSTRSRLFIDCASIQDEATYTCVADNEYSQLTSNTKLNLEQPQPQEQQQQTDNSSPQENDLSPNDFAALAAMPQCLSEERPQPARIQMWTHNIVEIMTNDVLLYCRSNIKQQQQQRPSQRFNVAWTTPEGKEISEDLKAKYEILETGDLLIRNLAWSDMGSYVCTVSDEQSSDTISSFVYPAQVRASAAAAETKTTATSSSNSLPHTSCHGNERNSGPCTKQQHARAVATQIVR